MTHIAATPRPDLPLASVEDEGVALLRHAITGEFRGRIAVVSSFGADSAMLLALVADIDPATPVLFRTYLKTENSHRQFCTRCGGHIMSGHPGFGMVDVYAATIPDLAFTPAVHVNYSETVLRMTDGLPKYADFPEAFGGSGTLLPE